MSYNRLFVAQIVMVMENQWFLDWGEPPVRTERKYYTNDFLFVAPDEEAAYDRVLKWLRNPGELTDSNNDLGGGGHTKYFPFGIHQLEEVALLQDVAKLSDDADDYVALPGIEIHGIDADGIPKIRRKEELEVFNPHRWRPPG